MNEENKHSSEASMDTKNTYSQTEKKEKETQAELKKGKTAGSNPEDTAALPVGISLASRQVKLEALPEVEQLTAELLGEAKNPAVPKRGNSAKNAKRAKNIKKVKKTEPNQNTTDKTPAERSDMAEFAIAAGTMTATKTTETTEPTEPPTESPKETTEQTEVPLSEETPAEKSSVESPHTDTTPATENEAESEAFKSKAEPEQPSKKPVRSRTKRIILTALLSVLGVVLVLVGIEAVRLMNILNSVNFVKGGGFFANTEMVVSESAIAKYVSHSDETKNILLVGYDIDENDISRSDSMIILTLDHEHQKIKMTSLMRDMYVYIPGHGRHKLNAAFVYGGPELLLETIYANFGLQIDNYVCVDYAAFVDVVDYIGGVQVDIEEIELEQFNKYVRGGKKNKIDQAGSYIFNGQQALSYCRIRKVGTDTARTARQREILEKIMKRCSRMSLLRLEHLLSITAPAVTTNLTQTEIFQLAAEGLDSMDYEMQGMRIPVDGAWWDENIGGTWYVALDLNANAGYLYDFIYGDNEISDTLAANLAESDSAAEEREKESFEQKKALQEE